MRAGLPRWCRRTLGSSALCVAIWMMATRCSDVVAPPPEVASRLDFHARFDAGASRLVIEPPTEPAGGGPLRLEVVNLVTDSRSSHVLADVVFRNVADVPIAGPQGAWLFGFTPSGIGADPDSGALWDPPDEAARPPSRSDAWLVSHRGAYGASGMLAPQAVSRPVRWAITGWTGGGFEFDVQPTDAGLAAAGRIEGVVFEDRDGDGRRQRTEPGLPGEQVRLDGSSLAQLTTTDSSGAYAFEVTAADAYNVTIEPGTGCTATLAASRAIGIEYWGDGLSSFGRADFGCGAGAPPRLEFSVEIDSLPPCAAAWPCTIPFGRRFRIGFTGITDGAPIAGYAWRTRAAGAETFTPWQPFGDGGFVAAGRDTGGALDPWQPCQSLCGQWTSTDSSFASWGVHAGRVEVAGWSSCRPPSGPFELQALARDSAGHVSELDAGTVHLQVNRDPETRIERIPACDCPHPPPDCAAGDSVPIGWITGYGSEAYEESPVSEWRPFCAGDTIPRHALARFFVHGRDDRRDLPCDPNGTRAPVGFTYRYEWQRGELGNHTMPYAPDYAWGTFQHPGGPWSGGSIFVPPCPYDYTFFATAVDEHGRLDGSPDSLPYVCNFTPTLDSLCVPGVIVLATACGPELEICPDVSGTSFGPDTLLLVGMHVPVPPYTPPVTPLGLGLNRFVLPLRGYGHDDPRDRYGPQPSNWGRIEAWMFRLDCVGAECADIALPHEGQWWDDTGTGSWWADEQVFEQVPSFDLPLDTLRVGDRLFAVLAPFAHGEYIFQLQGRDTSVFETSTEPSDLGPNPSRFRRQVAELGNLTAQLERHFVIRELRDVRPLHPAAAPVFAAPTELQR